MNPTDSFLEHVKSECDKHGVRFKTTRAKRMRYQGYISGYFEDDPPSLGVALGNPQWLWVLVHEYAHMMQWLEKCDEWTNVKTAQGNDAWIVMGDHLEGLSFSQEELDEAYAIVIRCERDCDQRAVKLIKKFNLPIDLKQYIKQANAYHYFYHGVKAEGKWYGKVPIYRNPKVVSLCPDDFRCQPEKHCPQEIFDAILDHIKGNHNISY